MSQIEIWKDIEEFKGFYQISNEGRIRRIKTKDGTPRLLNYQNKINSTEKNKGYFIVVLSVNGKHYTRYIHRLVAFAFLKRKHNFKEVNHKDGNKFNNNKNNLEWCSRKYNCNHSRAHLKKRGKKITIDQVKEIIKLSHDGYTLKTIAKKYNIGANAVGGIMRNVLWPSSRYEELQKIREMYPYKRKYSGKGLSLKISLGIA